MKEVVGTVRAGMSEVAGRRAGATLIFAGSGLRVRERFVEQEATGSQGALDAGKGLAVEILEAED